MDVPADRVEQLTQEVERLRKQLGLLKDALENMHHGLCMFDGENRVAVSNRRFAEILALPAELVRPGMTATELIELGIEAGCYEPGRTGEEIERDIRANLVCGDDERRTMVRAGRTYAVCPRWLANGHLVVTFEDVTDRTDAEKALRESEERFRLAADGTGIGVWDYDPETERREWSARLPEIFGLPQGVQPSLELASQCIHPDDRETFLAVLHEIRDGHVADRFQGSYRVIRMNDRAERWMMLNCWKIKRLGRRSRVILTIRDITDEKLAEERIRWNAGHDPLTRLANRARFQERLEKATKAAAKNGGEVGLLLLDLDHFKQINDALGHDAGDKLLQMFARRLEAAVRSGDTVARFGGDEFAIIVPRLKSPEVLAAICTSIHERLKEPFVHSGRMLDCRASIGAAIYPRDGANPEDLLKNADMALYAAKDSGRANTAVFEPRLREEGQKRASMVELARAAIRDDRLLTYYQPKLDLRRGAITGFEALLRWRDAQGDIQYPASLKAAFEDHDVAAEISARIIRQAIGDMREWLDQGIAFDHVAVNASAAEFRHDNFAERVLEALSRADIPPRHFQLEITEKVFLGRGAEYVQRALTRLSGAGIKIALDDFGTGYASLRHLKQFPVDIIKIDRSFVRDMESDRGNEAIIRAVINLGRTLGIGIVAEGIERMSQAERLIAFGCDYGQGFLFSRAVPGSSVPSLVARAPERGFCPTGRPLTANGG